MEGVISLSLKEARNCYPGLLERYTKKDIGVFIYVPKDIKIRMPYITSRNPYTLIIMEPDSELTYVSENDSVSVEAYIGPGAHLYFLNLSRDSKDIYTDSNLSFFLKKSSICDLFFLDLAKNRVKRDVKVSLLEEDATSNIRGIYILEGNELLQYHILQEHKAPFTTSNLVYKGILKDDTKGLFKGEITIEKEAVQSDAYQANYTLILGENASIDTIPILEIKNNDLKRCTHGATVGQIDEDILFYMKSRGLEDKEALKLISIGFLEEIIEDISSESIKLKVLKYIEEKLEVNN
jgi:Fe-S cluster assembly protein SufD